MKKLLFSCVCAVIAKFILRRIAKTTCKHWYGQISKVSLYYVSKFNTFGGPETKEVKSTLINRFRVSSIALLSED